MLPPVIWNIVLLTPVIFVFVVPVIAALFSRLEQFPAKFWWALLALLFNWFGYFAYYYYRVKNKPDRETSP